MGSSFRQDNVAKNHSATTDEDDGNISDNFFDAVENTSLTPKNEGSSDENEFVMIQHPTNNSTSTSASTNNDLTVKKLSSDGDNIAQKDKKQNTISPFDAVFGGFNTEAPQLDIDNPFSTISTKPKSSVKTPPPPPQSRKVKREIAAAAVPTVNASSASNVHSATDSKKDEKSSQRAHTTVTTEDEFETYFSDPKFAESANNGGSEQALTPSEPKQKEGEKQGEKLIVSSTAVGEEKKKKKKKGLKIVPGKKNIVSWAKNFGSFDFSGTDSDNKKEEKEKNANKIAISEPTKRKVHKTNVPKETPSITQKPSTVPSSQPALAPVEEPVTSQVLTAPPVFDIGTIQGSHIAELVNMGFDPAAAKDALDRYDQDIEKATNYLLDQFN
jgi:hypothetical protein